MVKVKKIILTDVPTLKKEATIEEAAKLLIQGQVGCVIVIENKVPIGIITESDFVKSVVSKGKSLKEPLSKIMTSPVMTMTPNMRLDEALKIVDTRGFRRYPIVDNGELVGLVTKKDIVNAISDNVRFHRNIQNIILILFVLFEFFVFVFSA